MLSIHSLAADLGSDPRFLLSNLEINRVAWKRGAHKNELVVEIDLDTHCAGAPSIELDELDADTVDACALSETRCGPLGPLSPGGGRTHLGRSGPPPGIHFGPKIHVAKNNERWYV